MSEEPGPTFTDADWSVRCDVYPDERRPIVLSIEDASGIDEWFAITVSLTKERAQLLTAACEQALRELEK